MDIEFNKASQPGKMNYRYHDDNPFMEIENYSEWIWCYANREYSSLVFKHKQLSLERSGTLLSFFAKYPWCEFQIVW